MKKKLLLLILAIYCFGLQAQDVGENNTADYINSLFYYKNLDVLRGSFFRWDLASKKEPELSPENQGGIYGATYNFNSGRNIEGATRIPMLFGLALGNTKFGYYALTNTSHMRIFDPADTWTEKLNSDKDLRFEAHTAGFTYRNKWIGLITDITYVQNTWSYFAQLSIPIIKTRAGVSFSQFNEVMRPDGGESIINSGDYSPEYYFINSALIRSLNVGLNIFSYSNVKVSPNISFALYQLRKKSNWENIRFDMEAIFKTNAPDWNEVLKFEDYDARLIFYWMNKSKMASDKIGNMLVKATWIFALSYKSEVDYFAETLSSSGSFYKNLYGWGGEIGGGVRVMGFKQYGAVEETFMKLVFYYNYTEHNEMYPPLIGGIKFKVTY